MEVFEIMVASLMINVCVLIVIIASWMMVRRRPTNTTISERRLNSENEEEESKTDPLDSDDPSQERPIRPLPQSITMEVYTMSDVITSIFCFISGLYLTTSPYVWKYPFVAMHHTYAESDRLSSDNHSPNHNEVWSKHEAASTVLLSATFGCFIFSFFHLAIVCNRTRAWCLWTVFRAGYLFITLVTFFAIITTKENLLGASLILLMEIDAAIEGVCHMVDSSPIEKYIRTARTLLSIVGCITSIGTRIVMTWTMCILLGKAYNPIAMSVLSLGISSFGFIFYQAYTLLVIKKHADQLRKKLEDEDTNETTDSDAIEPFQKKSRRLGSKGVAFHLMNEGLVEISTYAKTVAGVISGKKLLPIKNLCDNLQSTKPSCQPIFSALPRK